MEASMWKKVLVRIDLEEVASQKQYSAASCILLGIQEDLQLNGPLEFWRGGLTALLQEAD